MKKKSSRIEIKYCTKCGWLLRATWVAQELLTTFKDDINELALVPGTGGIFEIRIEDKLVWSREEMEGFPQIKKLKQLVRNQLDPQKDLGHTDRTK